MNIMNLKVRDWENALAFVNPTDDPRNGLCPYIQLPSNELARFAEDHDRGTPTARSILALCRQQEIGFPAYGANVIRMRDTKQTVTNVPMDKEGNWHVDIEFQAGRERNNKDITKLTAQRIQEKAPCFLDPKTGKSKTGETVYVDDGQRGIYLGYGAWVLPNLFPNTLDGHTTVPVQHTLQRLSATSKLGFVLAGALSNRWNESLHDKNIWYTFYNSDLFGASAGDHGHLQTAFGRLPALDDVSIAWHKRHQDNNAVLQFDSGYDGVTTYIPRKIGRAMLVVVGYDPDTTELARNYAISSLPSHPKLGEPGINYINTCMSLPNGQRFYTSLVVPRGEKSFRAFNFSGDPDEQDPSKYALGIAALEAVAGRFLTTLPKDYEKLVQGGQATPEAKDVIPDIMKDVTMSTEELVTHISSNFRIKKAS